MSLRLRQALRRGEDPNGMMNQKTKVKMSRRSRRIGGEEELQAEARLRLRKS